jgi:hypothetical protein
MEICPSMGKEATHPSRGAMNNLVALLRGRALARPAMTSRMTSGMICTINRTKNARDRVEDHRVEDHRVEDHRGGDHPANLGAGDTSFFAYAQGAVGDITLNAPFL